MQTVRPTILAAALLSCAACALTPTVHSDLAQDANRSPRSVLVVSHLPKGHSVRKLGSSLEKDFESRIQAQLGRCGVKVSGIALEPLDDDDAVKTAVAELRPDALLVAETVHTLFGQNGDVMNTTFALRIVQAGAAGQKAKVVWRGSAMYFPRYTEGVGQNGARTTAALYTTSMEEYVDALVAKMKEDGFFPGCPTTPLRHSPTPVLAADYAPRTLVAAAGAVAMGTVTDPRPVDPENYTGTTCFNGSFVTCTEAPEKGNARLNGQTVARFWPNFGDYTRAALGAELGRMGIDTADRRRLLDADIEEARTDAAGWAFGVYVRIRFTVKDGATGKVLYQAAKEATSPPGAVGPETAEVDQALLSLAEQLARDPAFVAAIR